MVLAVDVGNSNIVLGGYENGRLLFMTRLATDHMLEADQYALQLGGVLQLYNVDYEDIEKIIISSVVPQLTQVLVRGLARVSSAKPHILTVKDAGDVQVAIDNPAEIGTDILASAISVRGTRPLPAVIIDMGTATKISALDEEGRLLGVAICPGMFVSLNALVKNTSTLGNIPMEAPKNAIGKNTPESMKSGVVLGSAAMLDGMIDRFAEELGGLKSVVATGGAAGIIVPQCRHKIELCDQLILDGLYRVALGG